MARTLTQRAGSKYPAERVWAVTKQAGRPWCLPQETETSCAEPGLWELKYVAAMPLPLDVAVIVPSGKTVISCAPAWAARSAAATVSITRTLVTM